MILTYNFDPYGNEYSFDIYEDSSVMNEAKDYILRTHTPKELMIDYMQYLYPSETDSNKKIVKDDYGFDGTKESIEAMDEELMKELIDQFVYELIDLDLYTPELEDYFEEEAYEQYKDAKAYSQDPYSYYGLRRSDFL